MEPQFKTPVTARIRGSDRSLPPFGDRNQLKTNDKVYGMTPPGVFFLAIFQQTANLKQIYLYDSAICQQLQFDPHHFVVSMKDLLGWIEIAKRKIPFCYFAAQDART